MSQSTTRTATAPDTAEARAELEALMKTLMDAGADAGIQAETSMGKTHKSNTIPWGNLSSITDGEPVIHTQKLTDARDEAAQFAEEAGISNEQLFAAEELCLIVAGLCDDDLPLIDGQTASEWMDDLRTNAGLMLHEAHEVLQQEVDQELACMKGDSKCPASAQWEGVPRDKDGQPVADIIQATHPMLHVPSLTKHTNVIIDEQPTFSVDLQPHQLREAVTRRLEYEDTPVSSWSELIEYLRHQPDHPDLEQTKDSVVSGRPDLDWYAHTPGAHRLDGAIIMALVEGERRALEHRYVGTFNTRVWDGQNEAHVVTVMLDEDWQLREVWNRPDLSTARSVLCMDAWPNEHEWLMELGFNKTKTDFFESVLRPDEAQAWRREERGLHVVQVGESTRPLTRNLEYLNLDRLKALAQEIVQRHGELNTVITSKAAKSQVKDALEDIGIEVEVMHFGGLKSRNDFGDEDVGLVVGSIDAGDERVKDILAYHDLNAEPLMKPCPVCSDSSIPECRRCGGSGKVRDRGRTFVGDDAPEAIEILRSFNEAQVAQALGRYARNPHDKDDSAVVYCWTSMAPENMVDEQVPEIEAFNDKRRAILEELAREDDRSKSELHSAIADRFDSISKSTVNYHLSKLKEQGLVRKEGASVNTTWLLEVEGDQLNPYGKAETASDELLAKARIGTTNTQVCKQSGQQESVPSKPKDMNQSRSEPDPTTYFEAQRRKRQEAREILRADNTS